jgi:DNA-binding NtrC family response regulator
MVFDAVIVHKTGDSDSLSIESFKGIVSGDALQTEQKALPDIPADSLALMYMIFGRFPTFDEVEGFLITEAMNLSKGNQSLAATYLGITRQTLNKRLKSRNEKKDR